MTPLMVRMEVVSGQLPLVSKELTVACFSQVQVASMPIKLETAVLKLGPDSKGCLHGGFVGEILPLH